MFQRILQDNKQLKYLLHEYGQKQLIKKLTKQVKDQVIEQKELLALFKKVKNYSVREIIFRQGAMPHYAYYLLNGSIELRSYDAKYKVTSRTIIHPNQFFGERSVIKNEPYAGNAVVITDSKVR